VGAGRTITRFRNHKATSWGPREGFPDGEIYGMSGDSHGGLWIVSASAVLHIARAELDRVPDGVSQRIRVIEYDSRDGLRLAARGGMGSPRITVAVDGRVWVSERDGVGIMDPELLRTNRIPPPVSVEGLTLDGKAIPGNSPSFRGRELRIAYTGLSLTAPERVHFRYRLEPVEPRWTDADTRREVTFVNLAPGNYRFHVIAANLDDVWNTSGAALDFRVQPYFSQTIWFKLLLAMTVGLFGFGVYRLRLAQMKSRFQLVMQERMRLTREIHDSLLQGFAGVVLQLYGISARLDKDPEGSKEKLGRALEKADQTMREARQMLLDMRLPVLEDSTLPEALAEVGAKATEGTTASFQLRTKGEVAPLAYAAQAAMFFIGREAIHNAVNHAEAGRITVELVYAEKEFRMTVQDDGVGFDPAAAERKTGHLGMRSMTERARQAGAELRIDSARGRGTTIEVRMARTKPAP
jgi:signal transduction histidine kinase